MLQVSCHCWIYRYRTSFAEELFWAIISPLQAQARHRPNPALCGCVATTRPLSSFFSPSHTPQKTGCLRHLNPTSLFPSGAYCTVACILSPLFLSFYFGRWAYHCFHRPQSPSDVSVLQKDFVLFHPLIATLRADQPPGYFLLIYTLYFFLALVLIYLPSPPLLTQWNHPHSVLQPAPWKWWATGSLPSFCSVWLGRSYSLIGRYGRACTGYLVYVSSLSTQPI